MTPTGTLTVPRGIFCSITQRVNVRGDPFDKQPGVQDIVERERRGADHTFIQNGGADATCFGSSKCAATVRRDKGSFGRGKRDVVVAYRVDPRHAQGTDDTNWYFDCADIVLNIAGVACGSCKACGIRNKVTIRGRCRPNQAIPIVLYAFFGSNPHRAQGAKRRIARCHLRAQFFGREFLAHPRQHRLNMGRNSHEPAPINCTLITNR